MKIRKHEPPSLWHRRKGRDNTEALAEYQITYITTKPLRLCIAYRILDMNMWYAVYALSSPYARSNESKWWSERTVTHNNYYVYYMHDVDSIIIIMSCVARCSSRMLNWLEGGWMAMDSCIQRPKGNLLILFFARENGLLRFSLVAYSIFVYSCSISDSPLANRGQ